MHVSYICNCYLFMSAIELDACIFFKLETIIVLVHLRCLDVLTKNQVSQKTLLDEHAVTHKNSIYMFRFECMEDKEPLACRSLKIILLKQILMKSVLSQPHPITRMRKNAVMHCYKYRSFAK